MQSHATPFDSPIYNFSPCNSIGTAHIQLFSISHKTAPKHFIQQIPCTVTTHIAHKFIIRKHHVRERERTSDAHSYNFSHPHNGPNNRPIQKEKKPKLNPTPNQIRTKNSSRTLAPVHGVRFHEKKHARSCRTQKFADRINSQKFNPNKTKRKQTVSRPAAWSCAHSE